MMGGDIRLAWWGNVQVVGLFTLLLRLEQDLTSGKHRAVHPIASEKEASLFVQAPFSH